MVGLYDRYATNIPFTGYGFALPDPDAGHRWTRRYMMASTIPPDNGTGYSSLVTALCERDPYTRGHCDRVCVLALEMGRAAALSASSLGALRVASQLHDVGKIGVPDGVLLKPGKLTPEEWEDMKAHSVLGERMVRDTFLPNGAEVATLVRHHHEAFDGSGYPDRLAGADIPEGCRILSVIDAYDAMTTGRPYHKARSHREAMGTMEREVGTKFDPDIFCLFIKFIAGSPVRAS